MNIQVPAFLFFALAFFLALTVLAVYIREPAIAAVAGFLFGTSSEKLQHIRS